MELMQSLCRFSCLSVCFCSNFWAFWAKPSQILSERWVSHWWWHSCTLWKEAPRRIREATGVSHFWEKWGVYSHTIRAREDTQLRPVRLQEKQLQLEFTVSHQTQICGESGFYWCNAHKNTATLGINGPHALKSSYFYFLFLASRNLHFLFSRPMPIFVLNLILVIKAKELKTKLSIFTLPL